MKGFSSRLELRIDWSELDAFGHVNNLAILKYVQTARVKYLEAIGLMQSQSEKGIGPILASMTCQFRRPLFYPGKVIVRSKVDEIGNTSFRIQHRVYNGEDEIAAEAQDVLVLYDFAKETKLLIPTDLKTKIRRLESASGTTAQIAAQAGA